MRRQTFMARKGQVPAVWRHIDAAGVPLGRLAAEVALVLMGKHRPEYTPHVPSGDNVVVTNAKQIALTGHKADQKFHQRYTEYPGGLKMESYGSLRQRRPELLVKTAVRRMLPKNRLSRVLLANLMVYPEAAHPHTGETLVPLTV